MRHPSLCLLVAFMVLAAGGFNANYLQRLCDLEAVSSMLSSCCRWKAFARARAMAAAEDAENQVTASKSVAVVFIGQLRALHTDVVLKRIQEELIKPLDPDVFLVCSTNNTLVQDMHSIGSGVGHLGDFNILTTEEILKRLKPVDHRFYQGNEHLTVRRSRTCASSRKIYAQFWPFPEALAMILAAERVRQRRYDWILRSRPDVTFLGRPLQLPPWSDTATVFGQAYYHGCLMCDQFFLATRSALEAVFSVEDSFRRCEEALKEAAEPCWCCSHSCHRRVKCGAGRNMGGFDTECTISRHLRQRNVVINTNRTFLLQTHRLHLVEASWRSSRHLTMEPGLACPSE